MTRGISSDPIYNMLLSLYDKQQRPLPVLDIGAGSGYLLRRLLALGIDADQLTGIDLMPRPDGLDEAVTWYQADLNDSLPLGSGLFQAVMCSEVIEHLENPRGLMREIARLLMPGGRLFLTTPNQECLRSYATLLVRGHYGQFQDRDYPAHITALLRKDMQRILAESGFGEPEFVYSNSGVIPIPQCDTMWQSGIFHKIFHGRWFSDNFGLVAVKR